MVCFKIALDRGWGIGDSAMTFLEDPSWYKNYEVFFFFFLVVIYAVDHTGLSFFLFFFLSGDIDRILYSNLEG